MSEVKNAVAKRVEQLCSQRGITYNELANLSGITPSTVYSLLSSKRNNVSITTIKIICDGLNITLREFFSTEEFDNLVQEIE